MTWIPEMIPFANLVEITEVLVFVMVLRLYHAVEASKPRERAASTRTRHT